MAHPSNRLVESKRSVAAPVVARIDALSRYGLTAAVVMLFMVSGGMLWVVGYNYEGLTGGAISKIHPATYLVFLILVWRSCVYGNPIGFCVHLANQRPGAAFMAGIAAMVLIFVILRQRPNMAGLVDTYLGAALLVLLLADADRALMARLEKLLHGMMTLNALLALFEFATKHLLFPFRLDGQAFETDLRSSAFHGHPLSNAAVTACYVAALLSGARNLPNGLRFALIALQGAALVAFGGRTAMVAIIVFGSAYCISRAYRTLRHRRVSLPAAAVTIMLVALSPVVLGGLAAYGFFDALLERFLSDGGSANSRIEMLELFQYFTLHELIVGPDLDLLDTVRRMHGLEWGIENPIIRMTLYQGAFITLLMALGFAIFMYELTRRCLPGTWVPMAVWLLVMMSAETISSKTTLLSKFCVIILCLYYPGSARQPRPVNQMARNSGFGPRQT